MNSYKLQMECYKRGFDHAKELFHIESEWVPSTNGYTCKRCETEVKIPSHYCPQCGACNEKSIKSDTY